MISNAFTKFQRNYVDLSDTKAAKASRAFLIEQIQSVSGENGFPNLAPYAPLNFGSFARGTKLQPLDDIDILLPLNGRGTECNASPNDPYTQWLKIKDSTAPLATFPDAYGYVNSTIVTNAIKTGLSKVKQYKKADIKRSGESAVLELASYSWAFDIVPAVPIDDGRGGTAFYLIPDGRGNWKKTDPRIDEKRINAIDTARGDKFRPLCRLLKYWNNRTTKPKLPSYYFETLVYNTFANQQIQSTPNAVEAFFASAPAFLNQSCPDPKNLGPNLDADVGWDVKKKVIASMDDARKAAKEAIGFDWLQGYERHSLAKWQAVFGPIFVL